MFNQRLTVKVGIKILFFITKFANSSILSGAKWCNFQSFVLENMQEIRSCVKELKTEKEPQ